MVVQLKLPAHAPTGSETVRLSQALARIHALRVLHGDIREENILLGIKDSRDEQTHCQVRGSWAYGCVRPCLADAVATR